MAYQKPDDYKPSRHDVETAIEVLFYSAKESINFPSHQMALHYLRSIGDLCVHKISLEHDKDAEYSRVMKLQTIVDIAYNLNIVPHGRENQKIIESAFFVMEHLYDLTRIPF